MNELGFIEVTQHVVHHVLNDLVPVLWRVNQALFGFVDLEGVVTGRAIHTRANFIHQLGKIAGFFPVEVDSGATEFVFSAKGFMV